MYKIRLVTEDGLVSEHEVEFLPDYILFKDKIYLYATCVSISYYKYEEATGSVLVLKD